MKRFFFLGLTFFLVAFSAHAEETKLASPTIIKPHRAIYKMSLASVKNGSGVSDVSGTMLFEWADACEGWAIQQQMQLHFSYAEQGVNDITSRSVSWESKSGSHYNFNVRRLTNGEEDENYRGRAVMAEKNGEAHYLVPEGKTVQLPEGTLFPSAHTSEILAMAERGEKFFTRHVFDGSDEAGSADVSAFIGERDTPPSSDEKIKKITDDPSLLAEAAWPVRLAFFSDQSETGEPDYEMDLILHPNGIARSMIIDYGDFSVLGHLIKLEAIPEPGC